MRAPAFNAIIWAEGIYDYYIKRGSLELYVDPLYRQGAHKVTCGIVYAPPLSMPDEEKVGIPIKAGDKVYFHYNSLDESSMVPETKGLFLVPMDMLFCYVRDGIITPLDGKALCKPYYDENVVEISDRGSRMKVKQTASGIITELNVKHNYKRAILSFIGPPWKGYPVLDIKPGDSIYYATDADFENVIEGETYFVMDQDLILAAE